MADEELVNFEEEEEEITTTGDESTAKKGHYVGIHSTTFKDFVLKPELLKAITDNGFEHPSEVQQECIPQALLGLDVICQAQSGMGKTAVFVLTSLQQLNPVDGEIHVVVLAHSRELANQINEVFTRFKKHINDDGVRCAVFYGGIPLSQNKTLLGNKDTIPHIVVGTPGRMKQLAEDNIMDLSKVKIFVLDECDNLLQEIKMRSDVQAIFKKTPYDKQVMMFSATLSEEIRPVCKKYLQDPLEIYIDNEKKLTLHGLQQYYIKLTEQEKNRKLSDLLDALEFNQVVIFVSKVQRAKQLDMILQECNFPSMSIYGRMPQKERNARIAAFKNFEKRILVTTDLLGRGVDIERVNIVINYDFPIESDSYLHRVGRAGRFGTKGLSISFVSNEKDAEILDEIQSRFEVDIPELPDSIDKSSYMPEN